MPGWLVGGTDADAWAADGGTTDGRTKFDDSYGRTDEI